MLRLSSNHDKVHWVKRLRELPCESRDVCELRNACVAAYDEYLSAIAAMDALRKDLLSPPADASAPDASAELYLQAAVQAQSAQRALGKSRQPMRQCAENEAVIRQRYKIH